MDAKKIFESMCRLAIKESIGMVQEYAGEHHRFTPRTGNLERSIKIMQQGLVGTVYLDEGQAPYGIPIHNGAPPRHCSPNPKSAKVGEGRGVYFRKEGKLAGHSPRSFLVRSVRRQRGGRGQGI